MGVMNFFKPTFGKVLLLLLLLVGSTLIQSGYVTTNSEGVVDRQYGFPAPVINHHVVNVWDKPTPYDFYAMSLVINAVFWAVVAWVFVGVYSKLGGKPIIGIGKKKLISKPPGP